MYTIRPIFDIYRNVRGWIHGDRYLFLVKMNHLSFVQRIHLTLPLRGDDTILLAKKNKEDFYNE